MFKIDQLVSIFLGKSNQNLSYNMKHKTLNSLDAMSRKKAVTVAELEKEYEVLKQSLRSFDCSITKSIKEIRLKKLAGTVAQILVKAKQNSSSSKKKIKRKEENVLYDRWKYAQKRGNEFSKHAIEQLANENVQISLKQTSPNVTYLDFVKSSPNTEEELRYERLRYARQRGNQYSKLAKQTKTYLEVKGNNQNWSDDMTTVCLKKVIYGNYYTTRNRLLYKDSVCEYDQEFHLLLLKCALFEREHEDVRGFLREKIFQGTFHTMIHESPSSESESSWTVSSKKKLTDCCLFKVQRLAATLNPSIVTEVTTEPHLKEIGTQVSEDSIPKTSEKSNTENVVQDPIIFVDTDERLHDEPFDDADTLSEDKVEFKDTEKDSSEFEDDKSNDFKEPIEKIGDQV